MHRVCRHHPLQVPAFLCLMLIVHNPLPLLASNDPITVDPEVDHLAMIRAQVQADGLKGLPPVNERLILYAEVNNVTGLKITLEEGADINFQGHNKKTALMAASLTGADDAIRFLMDQDDIDPLIPERDGYTPMHGAAFQGRAKAIKALFEAGMDPSDRHADGFTPIHRCAFGREEKHLEAIKAFLEIGIDVNELSSSKETPLDTALSIKSENNAEFLRSVGGLTYKELKKQRKAAKRVEEEARKAEEEALKQRIAAKKAEKGKAKERKEEL